METMELPLLSGVAEGDTRGRAGEPLLQVHDRPCGVQLLLGGANATVLALEAALGYS